MNQNLQSDLENIQTLLQAALQESVDYLTSLDTRNVSPSAESYAFLPLSVDGIGASRALSLFKERYSADLTASSGGRSFGYVVGGTTPAALVGDWLTSAFDQDNGEGITIHLENEAIHLLRQLFGLSDANFGSFVSGATMSNFVGLALARQWIANKRGIDVAVEGLYKLPPIKVLSGKPHSSIYKSLSMLGMGRETIIEIACLPETEICDLTALEKQLKKFEGEFCIVVANAGTVNSAAFDDFKALGKLKKIYGFWLHVDAAFGLFAACSPKFEHLVKGIDAADSIAVDAHKWLNVPYDSAVQFTKHKDLQRYIFQNSNAAYLGDLGEMTDYMNHTPETSRRLRALTAWFTVMAYGKEGYREIVERNCRMAKLLADKIEASDEFELLTPTNFNVVCFTLKNSPPSFKVNEFLEKLTNDGTVFMTPTVYKEKAGIRAALCNWRTTENDIKIAWDAMRRCIGKQN